MFYVATLISHPDRPAISDALLQKVARVLPQAGPASWLAPGVAADIIFGAPANQAGVPEGLDAALDRQPQANGAVHSDAAEHRAARRSPDPGPQDV